MKKLLTIFGSVGIMVLSASTLTACTNRIPPKDRSDTLAEEAQDQLNNLKNINTVVTGERLQLGVLENNNQQVIRDKFYNKNKDLGFERDDFMVSKWTLTSAKISQFKGYSGEIIVEFQVLENLIVKTDLGTIPNNSYTTIENKIIDINKEANPNNPIKHGDFVITNINHDRAIVQAYADADAFITVTFKVSK
ncbi:Vmc-like lipoprotein signal peptide domain-containing protein [Williamsoniiplasma lucivorax]|uniref:Lipoprotein n=1 Tax=Williamsoniiplasma lucivorax TaxID=209274 RepID=A0A2S5RFS3_9MOLU|nr:hypothetical protein [Williamsoniiplasma lucivorax]PPE05985.1 hypothetical protein ELUCI_v1c02760 [Williamsoniiplasma lucivorax]